jgi:hypothetical protein
MKPRFATPACLTILMVSGCVTPVHRENAALRAAWPQEPAMPRALTVRSDRAYPSAGGDILAGTSPEDLAAARAAASKALTDALAKP